VASSWFLFTEQVSYFVGFVSLMKGRDRRVKVSLCIHPQGWDARIDPGGVSIVRFGFVYFIGNTNNGGMKCPVGPIEVKILTRDP